MLCGIIVITLPKDSSGRFDLIKLPRIKNLFISLAMSKNFLNPRGKWTLTIWSKYQTKERILWLFHAIKNKLWLVN